MKHFLALFLIILLILPGCRSESIPENNEFTDFTNQLFIQEVSSDALTLNFSLKSPDDYGITKPNSPLGSYTYESMKQGLAQTENCYQAILSFQRDSLSPVQQILFDTLTLSFSHALKEQDFLLYNQILSPMSGIQAQLPVLLCEFHFSDQNDIEQYFGILDSLPSYFDNILQFEKIRAANNTYMNASTVSGIINQCKEFIKTPEENVLIAAFPERIQNLSFLSDQEKDTCRKRNQDLVLDSVIRAYQSLILGLESLQEKAKSDGGLSTLKGGRTFYKYKVEYEVGTLRPMEEIWGLLEASMNAANEKLQQLASEDPTLFSRSFQAGVHANTPSEILKTLEESITDNFPESKNVNYEVKYVHPSLEKYLSPAFYLMPPMDKNDENVIYINGATRYINTDLFPTLAHEGYPGHLYQSVYQNEHQISPLQGLLNFGGYSEGWATYAEIYSYRYAGLADNIAKILEYSTISSLMLTSLCDIGVNYNGWTLKDTMDYLAGFRIQDEEACEEIYQAVLDEPASYLKYSVGYLEIMELKKKAKKILGRDYTDMTFHKYILAVGPTWFEVLNNHMNQHLGNESLLHW